MRCPQKNVMIQNKHSLYHKMLIFYFCTPLLCAVGHLGVRPGRSLHYSMWVCIRKIVLHEIFHYNESLAAHNMCNVQWECGMVYMVFW